MTSLPANKEDFIAQFARLLKETGPIYIHKIKAPTMWNDGTLDGAFQSWQDVDDFSIFKVTTVEDLEPIIVALECGRNTRDKIDCIWLTEREMQSCNIPFNQKDDEARIACLAARKLHHDANSDSEKTRQLLTLVATTKRRPPIRIPATSVKSVNAKYIALGCRAYETPKLSCEKCAAA